MERRDFLKLGTLFTTAALLNSCAPSLVDNLTDPTATNTSTVVPPTSTETKIPTETATTEPKTELQKLVEKYGPAKGVPVFEFHGDSYRMYDGLYEMNPERFNLPRIFPPNPNGKSGRPQGMTLPEIMTKFTGQEFETQK